MANKSMIKDYIESAHLISNLDEKQILISKGFIKLFPFSAVRLLSYSAISETYEGILQISKNGIETLDIRGSIHNTPLLRKATYNRKTEYFNGEEFILQTPKELLEIDMFKSYVIIVPICFGPSVIGYATPSNYTDTDVIDTKLLDLLTFYGQLSGKFFQPQIPVEEKNPLTTREREVLQRISYGENNKEMADNMKISEFTINDYIKSAMKKLRATNRVMAVAESIRQGYIK